MTLTAQRTESQGQAKLGCDAHGLCYGLNVAPNFHMLKPKPQW